MGYMTVKFIDKEYSIPEDLLIYIDLLELTTDVKMAVSKKFYQLLRNEEAGCIEDTQIQPEIDKQTGRFIAKLLEYGIYDRTVNDYLNDNKGVEFISEVNRAAFQNAKQLLLQELDEYKSGVEDALYKRDASITGMGFSIWSSSFINHAIYAAMEASTLKEQEAAANKEYQREIDALHNSITSRHDGAKKKYIDSVYIPNMEAAIAVFAYELLDTYVADLIKNGKLNKAVLNYISIDRSNDLLKNLSLSPNKKEILHKAFESCPYNLQVYEKTLSCNFMDFDTYQTARCFKQGTSIMVSLLRNLGEASYPTTFKINYDVAEKIAELTRNDVVSVLQPKVEDYAAAVVNAYVHVVEMLSKRESATEIMGEFSEEAIFGGSAISKGKASAYVAGLVPQKVWDDLTEKCGYTNLLNRIKAQIPGADNAQTKREVDLILEEKLYPFFETARNEIATKITIAKAAEEKRKAEEKILEQNRRARNKKMAIIITPIIIAAVVFTVVLNSVIIPNNKYKRALELYNDGSYSEAIAAFSALENSEDSVKHIGDCYIQLGDYDSAIKAYGTTDIVIPDGVTSIPADAFKGCETLTSITIPNSVNSIGYAAFANCHSLKDVYITDLAKWCSITFDDFTSNPMNFGVNLYLNGEPVTDIVIPDNITQINDYAFASCECLASVVIKNNVTSIGKSAFSSCDNLEQIILPNSITTIKAGAFRWCGNLTEVLIPDSVTEIGENAFTGCNNLATVSIPCSVSKIEKEAFAKCELLESVMLSHGVSYIGEGAFRECGNLNYISIPSSIEHFSRYAFEGCEKLISIDFGGTVNDWYSIEKEPLWVDTRENYTINFTSDDWLADIETNFTAGTPLTIADSIVYVENNEEWGNYFEDAWKHIKVEFGDGGTYFFYDDDGDSTGINDIGEMRTYRNVVLGESSEAELIAAYGSGAPRIFDTTTDPLYLALRDHHDQKYLDDSNTVYFYDYDGLYQIAFFVDNFGIVDFIAYFDGVLY